MYVRAVYLCCVCVVGIFSAVWCDLYGSSVGGVTRGLWAVPEFVLQWCGGWGTLPCSVMYELLWGTLPCSVTYELLLIFKSNFGLFYL